MISLLGHIEYGDSSDPSPQWFILSHTKSDDIQNSLVLQRKSLQAWSKLNGMLVD